MDIAQKIYKKIYFPLFEGLIKKRNTANYYKAACKTQWLSFKELEAKQLASLNQLLNFANEHSPYYSELLAADNRINLPLKSVSELSEMPILTKELIRANFEKMVTAPYRGKIWKKSTGGSTGQPLHFGYTQKSYEWRVAMSRRGYSWASGGPGSKQAYIWGMQLGEVSKRQRLKENIHHFIDRQKYFDCFNFNKKEMSVCLTSLNKWQPQALIGYTNPLYEFALYVESVGTLKFQPQSVICAAEKVHSFQREVLERVFRCPVFNTYGSREFMLIAAECEKHEGLHISMENLIVEVVDEDGIPVIPGEAGRILVTDLHNYGMPFIRYEIGDMARVSDRQCSCGRGLMLLDDIVGRSLDVIKTPDGKVVPGEFFPALFRQIPEIRRFQVVQKSLDLLSIRYETYIKICNENARFIDQQLVKCFGAKMNIEYLDVEKIDLTISGKYRLTISEIDK